MRLTFEISNEVAQVLHDHIPYGHRRHFYEMLINGLAIKLQKDRIATLAAIISNEWSLPEFLEWARVYEQSRDQSSEYLTDDSDRFD